MMRVAEKRQPIGTGRVLLSLLFAVICFVYALPLFTVFYNAFKSKEGIVESFFALPNSETLVGFSNFLVGMEEINIIGAAFYSLVVTLLSVFLILLCTSMCAWYISRVDSKFCRLFYYVCVFSMAVPFQMVMFTLSMVANTCGLNTPYTIPLVYLGFGAGLAVFMFSGFVRSIPLEIEEAATIDGCSPLQVFFRVVLPVMQPTYISVAILETMWVWNDYLLPYLVLDKTKGYETIPIAIQRAVKDSYGTVDTGVNMALLVLAILPVVIFYVACQKHIVKGIMAGAVKG